MPSHLGAVAASERAGGDRKGTPCVTMVGTIRLSKGGGPSISRPGASVNSDGGVRVGSATSPQAATTEASRPTWTRGENLIARS
jgi:hypothetical protein